MTEKQLSLVAGTWTRDRFAFGGSLLKGSHAKSKRCFSSRVPMHVVMRSARAVGRHSLMRHGNRIADVLHTLAARHHIRIYSVANAGNHLHLLVQAPSRELLSAFLRGVTGRIAQLVMEDSPEIQTSLGREVKPHKEKTARHLTDKIAATKDATGFWDARPFTRLVSWGADFRRVARYLGLNANATTLRMSREGTRAMFAEIYDLLRRGIIPRTPGLVATGF